jgi:anti-sigma factor RsiW
MTNPLTDRDYLQISAYLDGQLAPDEQRSFEDRLQGQPELRVALYDLRRTQTLLRSTPALKRPRNFMLSPEMVKARQRPRAYPFFQVIFAAASLLFAIVFTGDLVQTSVRSLGANSAPAAESVAVDTAGDEAFLDIAEEEAAAGAAEAAAGEAAPELEMAENADDSAADSAMEEPTDGSAESTDESGSSESAGAPTQAAVIEESEDVASDDSGEANDAGSEADAVDPVDPVDPIEENQASVQESADAGDGAADPTAPRAIEDEDEAEPAVEKSPDTEPLEAPRRIDWLLVGLRSLEALLLLTVLTSGAFLLYLRRR